MFRFSLLYLQHQWLPSQDRKPLIIRGARQVGQLLRTLFPFYVEPHLYYWQQDKNQSNAEIDYVIEYEKRVIPIEVKSGSTGNLKSLHLFMETKSLTRAVRINDDLPSITPVTINTMDEKEFSYTLLSILFYLTSQVHRFLQLTL